MIDLNVPEIRSVLKSNQYSQMAALYDPQIIYGMVFAEPGAKRFGVERVGLLVSGLSADRLFLEGTFEFTAHREI